MIKKHGWASLALCLSALACNSETPSSSVTMPTVEQLPTDSGRGANPDTTPTATPTVSPSPLPTARPTSTPTATPTVTPKPTVTPTSTPTTTPSGPKIALVYGGPGVLTGVDDTLERAKFVAQKAGFQVIVVTALVDEATLNSASVWIQPGGPNLSADAYMNNRGMDDQVRDFVTRGGGFVGFCGGAFSAVNNLDLIHGSAWNLGLSTGKIPVQWLGHTRYMHFEHGPYISVSDANAEVVATYANGSVAAVRSHYGKGEVFISGVHPEASASWPPTADPDGLDTDLAIGMINEVAARPTP